MTVNRLPLDRRIQAINCLVEGNSIRSTERLIGVHRDTILRLLGQVGVGCARLMDERMRGLSCRRIQVDEIWAFVGKKQRHMEAGDDSSRLGDQWTFVALDADTKLVPAYRVGKRDLPNATAFLNDLAGRLNGRIQLSSDGLDAYEEASEDAFGADVDYAQVVKLFESEPVGPGRYSPPKVVGAMKKVVQGGPDEDHISTSFVERQNLTMRMQMRRFTRLTNAFSKSVENLRAAVALHFAHYNFVRVHGTLRVTPAMAAGVSGRLWSIGDLVEAAEQHEAEQIDVLRRLRLA
jgi:IS1 family transposase